MPYVTSCGHLRNLFKEYNAILLFLIQRGLEVEVLNFDSEMELIQTRFQHPQLPRTNDIIERAVSKLRDKITGCYSFIYSETAWNSVKIAIMNCRFHKFTCSHAEGHNGKSPLELAGVAQGI